MTRAAKSKESSRPASNVIELPLVLTIGCAPSFVERCRMLGAVARAKFLVRECDLPTARRAPYRPVVIVVPRCFYERQSAELDRLAARTDAALLMC